MQVRGHQRRHRRRRVRRLSGQQMVGGAGEGVDVRAVVDLQTFDRLRADVVHRPHRDAGRGERGRLACGLRDPEVGEFHRLDLVAGECYEDVRGFDVAVSDPLLAPGVVQCRTGPADQREDELHRQPAVTLQQIAGVGAVDELHRDPESPVVLAAVVKRDDVRVRELREEVGLPLETRLEIVIAGDACVEQLEGVAPGKAGMSHQEHLAHAARAELPDDLVTGYFCEVHERSLSDRERRSRTNDDE